jgi:CBS domain-containing protein
MMKASEIMVKDVVTLTMDENTSAMDAARIMNREGIGCLIAVHHGEVVGILTERDLLKRIVEECRDPKQTKVSEIMTKEVVVGSPDLQLVEATRLMFEKRIKKLPIVDKNGLVGLITLTDIARATSVDDKTIRLIEALSNMHLAGESRYQIKI